MTYKVDSQATYYCNNTSLSFTEDVVYMNIESESEQPSKLHVTLIYNVALHLCSGVHTQHLILALKLRSAHVTVHSAVVQTFLQQLTCCRVGF